VDTEVSSKAEEWFILETNTYYWQGSITNLITGQSGSGSTSETYSSREQALYYANLKAGELNGDMVWHSEYTIASVRTGSETFLGRDCAKFVYQANSADINRRTDYWIDKATGACLKYIDDLQTTDGYVKTSWACTEFKIGGVSLPPHE
jgi:phosphoribulokinase